MRLIERKLYDAIVESFPYKNSNTEYVLDDPWANKPENARKLGIPEALMRNPVGVVKLFGNPIAFYSNGFATILRAICFAGYISATTCSRLRSLGVDVTRRKGRALIRDFDSTIEVPPEYDKPILIRYNRLSVGFELFEGNYDYSSPN